jgi:peptide/nickel transport system substrate-binding protein
MRLFFLLIYFVFSLGASTLQLATSSNPARLNPLLATDSSSSEITGFLFNGLVKFDKDNKKIVGDLAESFYFEDPKTLVFKLKKGVFWHDGKPFGAKDVLFTYKVLTSDKVVSPYASSFRFVDSVIQKDADTLVVKYKKPYFKALEIWMMGILPEHILKDEKSLMHSSFNQHPVGTGPYKLTQLEFSKSIELEAFDAYFEGAPKMKRIVFHVIADPMTRLLMLKNGELDLGSIEPLVMERQLKAEFFDTFAIYEKISLSYTYLGFNLRKKKFQDPRVREALSLAIDREALVDILFFKHAKVCSGPFLPGSIAFNEDIKPPKRDIQRAKELLREAGYDKEHPFRFEIATSNASSLRPYAAEILQYQLQQAGVEVKLRVMEWQAFLNMVVFPHNFDTVLLGWGLSPTPDPYLFWHSASDVKGGFNLVGYHNPKVDALIETSQSTIEKAKLGVLWREMFALIVKDNPYLFLYIPNSITAINKDIHPIKPALGGIWHNYIEWEK